MPKLTIELTDVEMGALTLHAATMRRRVQDQAVFTIAAHLESTGDLHRATQKALEAEQDNKFVSTPA